MDYLQPPRFGKKVLSWICRPEYLEEIEGDLAEEYATNDFSSSAKAKFWFYLQLLKLVRPGIIKKIKPLEYLEKEWIMFRNYLKIGIRNLWKYKASTVINVIGLSTGLAAFVLIALFISDELSYDQHHEHADHIYRVTVKNFDSEGSLSRHWAFASAGHATRLKDDYADITHSVRFYPWAYPDIEVGDKKFRSEPVIFTGKDVFEIFSFKFIQGEPETALKDLYSIVLTESSAIKLYGNNWKEEGILGKQLKVSGGGQEASLKITAVLEDMPEQQHFHFDYLAPIRFIEMIFGDQVMANVGGNYNWMTFIRTSPSADISFIQSQANDEFWDKYVGKVNGGRNAREFYDFEFQPLSDIHLHSNLEGEYETNGSFQQVVIFGSVGILLLLVACVNYMNLATSHYSRRMKEVGVRKVIGANRSSLINQFLTESMLITIVSLPLCIGLIYWALPFLNGFMDKSLIFNPVNEVELLIGLLLLLVAVGIIAGFYPALFLAKINLVNALKGEQIINANKWNFRSWLVTFQYAVTIALIFAIAVIESQMRFIMNTNPGFQKDQIVTMTPPRGANPETFKTEILSHPNILKATYSSRIPTGRLADNMGSSLFQGDSAVNTSFRLPIVHVDLDFLDTYEIELAAGEQFREGMKTTTDGDSIPPGYYIINEKAVKAYGFENPEDIIGQKMTYGPTEGHIIGVMKDFYFESMHSEIVPMILLHTDRRNEISMKVKPNEIRATLDYIEDIYYQFDPDGTPDYRFLDEQFAEQYQNEQRLGTMIKVFASIAILIGCLGLIGMVGFIIETKIKEIGVRKVLGASTQSIWILISNRFLILIGIGFAIALPITYWLMSGWLDNFVYRTSISVWIILLPALSAAIITLLAISYQTFRAARVNPVECLKNE